MLQSEEKLKRKVSANISKSISHPNLLITTKLRKISDGQVRTKEISFNLFQMIYINMTIELDNLIFWRVDV